MSERQFRPGDIVVSNRFGATHAVRIWDYVLTDDGRHCYCIEEYPEWQPERSLQLAPQEMLPFVESDQTEVREAALKFLVRERLKKDPKSRETSLELKLKKDIKNPPRRMIRGLNINRGAQG